ncbi:MAG: monophosphatase [Solirubrobacteraceae bacterium]|nr:monophosphatase [Solirubrobacteraceae bacterium]
MTPQPAPGELLEIATAAARTAGALLRERFVAGGEQATGSKSSPTDVVSEADLAAERAIRTIIAERRPGDAVLGEEGGETQVGEGLRWIVDPLDGTVNFLYGVPQWCVSIAVHDDDGGLTGVVFDPLREELFAGERGGEPMLNGVALAGSQSADLATSLVGTGFAYSAEVRELQAAVVSRLLSRVRDVRRMGSAALDLAWTAAGRYDAFYERGVQPWDIAAGVVLCECAGLEVRTLEGAGVAPAGIVVAPAGILEALERLVA